MANLQSTTITGAIKVGTTANTSNAGNIWFDTSANKLKYSYTAFNAGTWSAGTTMSCQRNWIGGAGQQNAGLIFNGKVGSAKTNSTEEYNGSSWSNGGNYLISDYLHKGTGEQNAALSHTWIGTSVWEYNGSSWATGGTDTQSRQEGGLSGQQNAGLAFGGYACTTSEYNGSSWSNTTNLPSNALINCIAGGGQQNSSVTVGGRLPSTLRNLVYQYNGSTWSTGTNYPITVASPKVAASTSDSAVAWGGLTPAATNKAYEFDGIAWSAGGNMSCAKSHDGGGGTRATAFAAECASTEEWVQGSSFITTCEL